MKKRDKKKTEEKPKKQTVLRPQRGTKIRNFDGGGPFQSREDLALLKKRERKETSIITNRIKLSKFFDEYRKKHKIDPTGTTIRLRGESLGIPQKEISEFLRMHEFWQARSPQTLHPPAYMSQVISRYGQCHMDLGEQTDCYIYDVSLFWFFLSLHDTRIFEKLQSQLHRIPDFN